MPVTCCSAWTGCHLWMSMRPVLRPRGARGFVVLSPRRWEGERLIGWIMNARRNCRNCERLAHRSEAHLIGAFITLMTRRLTRGVAGAESWAKKPHPADG